MMGYKNHGYKKTKRSFKALLTVMFAAALCVLASTTAQAYEKDYTNKYQINQTTSSVTVALDRSSYTDSSYYTYNKNFDVKIAEDYDGLKTAVPFQIPATSTSYTFNNLKSGTEYRIEVKLGYTSSRGSTYEYTIASGSIVTLPDQVQNLRLDRWWRYALDLNVKWDEGAFSGVEVDVRNSKNKKVNVGNIGSNYFTVNKISNSMIYTATVRPYTIINGQKYWGGWCPKIYMLTQPEVKRVSFDGKKITAKWTKVAGATGYDVYVSTDNKKYKKVKSLKKTASSVSFSKIGKKKLNKKKQYYVCIVTKKKVGKKTSNSGLNYMCPVKKGKPYTGGLNYTSFSTER